MRRASMRPLISAARGPAPTARSRKPQSVRAKTYQSAAAAHEREQQPRVKPGPGQERQPRRLGDRVALRVDVLRLLQRPLNHQADERLGDEVEQQRADHLEHAEAQLEPDRHQHPGHARESGGQEHRRGRDRAAGRPATCSPTHVAAIAPA